MVDNQELPFADISVVPNNITATNTLLRMVEGLAFRYRWATENLSEENIKFLHQKWRDLCLKHHIYPRLAQIS
jgi:hypothetical protein